MRAEALKTEKRLTIPDDLYLKVQRYGAQNDYPQRIREIMHASGTISEAEREIALWFSPEDIHDYRRTGEEIMFEQN